MQELNLPRDKFELQNWPLERTDLFCHIGKGKNRPRILSSLRDPGEANALIPVFEKLAEGCDLFVMADSRGKEILERSELNFLKAKKPTVEKDDLRDPLLRIASIKADLILTGFSMIPGSELALTANAQYDHVPVIWVEDYPGDIFVHCNRREALKRLVPDYFCVVNDWAKRKELENRPDYDPDKIIVTGQPSFDRFAYEDREGIKRRVRETLGIAKDEKFIVYIGTTTEIVSPETLKFLIKGLKDCGLADYKLAVRRHPRDVNSKEAYEGVYQEISTKVVDTTMFTTSEVGIAADLVVSTGSTEAVAAVYRGIPSLHIYIREMLEKHRDKGDYFLGPPPEVVEDESAPVVYKEDEIGPILKKIFFDEDYQAELKKKMDRWQTDGHATDRVVNLVLRTARDHRESLLPK